MPETTEDIVRFTAKELLARMDTKLDELNRKLDEHVHKIDERLSGLEAESKARAYLIEDYRNTRKKVEWLEGKFWVAMGAIAVGQILVILYAAGKL